MEGAIKYERVVSLAEETSVAKLARWIRPGSRVLETGPATGVMTKLLKNQLNCDVVCVEVDSEAAKRAEQYCRRMIVADLNSDTWIEEIKNEEPFDYIIFADVLEHLINPKETLLKVKKFLSTDGEILISIPNIGYSGVIYDLMRGKFEYRRDGILDETHLRFFTRSSVEKLLEESGISACEWDRTVLSPEFSEFKLDRKKVGESLYKNLTALPDSDTYQFLIRAKIGGNKAEADPVVRETKDSDQLLISKAYFDYGNGFSEENSIVRSISFNKSFYQLEFTTEASSNATRIDLFDRAIPFTISKIQIINKSGIYNLWTPSEGKFSSKFGLSGVEEFSINNNSYFIPNNDHFSLLIGEPLSAQTTIKIEFSISVSESLSSDLFSVQDKLTELESLKLNIVELTNHYRLASDQLEKLKVEADSSNKRISELSSSKTILEQDLISLRRKISSLEQDLTKNHIILTGILNSWSWKLSRPIRGAGKLLRFLIDFRGNLTTYINKSIQSIVLSSVKKTELFRIIKFFKLDSFCNPYEIYQARFNPTLSDLKLISEKSNSLSYKPKFSILLPTYKSNPKWLIEAIRSVQSQAYPIWELCIADDGSNDPGIRSILSAFSSYDKRIKVVFREKNGHISEASNSALEMASGDFVVLLDHDDKLSPQALFRLAEALNNDEKIDVIYSDEDKLQHDGVRAEPTFKPKWSPEYLLSFMYTGHISAFRTKLVRSVGGFRKGFEGSQDYDLMLRVTEKTEKIHHIPEILYHWRAHNESVAGNLDSKPYAFKAAKEAIQSAINRRGFSTAIVESSTCKGLYKIKYSQESYSVAFFPIEANDNKEVEIIRRLRDFCLINQGKVVAVGSAKCQEQLLSLSHWFWNPSIGAVGPCMTYEGGKKVYSCGATTHKNSIKRNFQDIPSDLIGYRGRLKVPFNVSLLTPPFILFRAEFLPKENFQTLEGFFAAICFSAISKNLRCLVDPSVKLELNTEITNLNEHDYNILVNTFSLREDYYIPKGFIDYYGRNSFPHE